jgi:hypothetical protein
MSVFERERAGRFFANNRERTKKECRILSAGIGRIGHLKKGKLNKVELQKKESGKPCKT